MDSSVHLAVDAMSGDYGLRVTVPAALLALQADPRLHLYLVGDEELIQKELNQRHSSGVRSRLDIVHAPKPLAHNAPLNEILRGECNSSLHQALAIVSESRAKALISAGPTAALLALGRQNLRMLPGFKRPAFCSAVPADNGVCYMLDLGANVDCDAEQLHEFAVMGSALVRSLHNIAQPRVGLLCNGVEETKGNAVIRAAAERLKNDSQLNYRGYVEGSDLHRGHFEVIVCDGLLGNVALKTLEGTAQLAKRLIAEQVGSNPWTRLQGFMSQSLFKRLATVLEGEHHGGAFLLGLQGLVVKSHGGAGETGFKAAILQAAQCIEQRMLPRMAEYLEHQENYNNGNN